MNKSKSQNIYVKDFIPSLPIPPLFMVEEKDLRSFFVQSLKVEYMILSEEPYIRYLNLFGENSILQKCWFPLKSLSIMTNHHLYCLELFLNDLNDERNILGDFPYEKDIFVKNLNFPFKNSIHMVSGGIIVK